MLVLTRKRGEKITIAGNIVVEIVEIDCSRVRLGITAPKEIKIARDDFCQPAPTETKKEAP